MAGSADEDVAITDINVTPLVDISLVLVIIFMVTSPMVVQSGIVVTSSKVTASHGKSTRSEAVQVRLTEKAIYVDNDKIDESKFEQVIKAKLAQNKKKLVIITSDRDVRHGKLVWVLDTSKMSGAKTISLMKEEKEKK
jgi:biopolymer transport protein ExbD